MPLYDFKCPEHGTFEERKPIDGYLEASLCPECGEWAWRVWSVPNLIMRPWGYHLRPDEPGYWALDRMMEVGHVPTPDANSHLGAGAPSDEELEADEYAGVPFQGPTEDGMQKLYEVARATFSESGSRL